MFNAGLYMYVHVYMNMYMLIARCIYNLPNAVIAAMRP